MTKTILKIDGMSCGMCEAHINDVIRRVCPEAKKVSSSHKSGKASFLTPAPADEGKLRAAIGETGYRVLSMTAEPYEKKGLFGRK